MHSHVCWVPKIQMRGKGREEGPVPGAGSGNRASQRDASSSHSFQRSQSALEGKGHLAERMTSFSHEAAAFRTVPIPAPAVECSCTHK